MLLRFLKLNNFKNLYAIFLPISGIFGLSLLFIGLKNALISSPIDYQQFDAVRIMYVHVPSAWLALGIYSFIAISNISAFIFRNPFFYLIAKAIAPIGAIFTLITLITGAIWGNPIWGTWWVWDARLTSVLILFFLYLGYIILVNSYEDANKGEKIAAILSIVGFINIPIIKFSVEFLNTLHQPASIMRSGGIAIAPEMLTPLLQMFGAFLCYTIFFGLINIKNQLNIKRINRLIPKLTFKKGKH